MQWKQMRHLSCVQFSFFLVLIQWLYSTVFRRWLQSVITTSVTRDGTATFLFALSKFRCDADVDAEFLYTAFKSSLICVDALPSKSKYLMSAWYVIVFQFHKYAQSVHPLNRLSDSNCAFKVTETLVNAITRKLLSFCEQVLPFWHSGQLGKFLAKLGILDQRQFQIKSGARGEIVINL